MSLTLVSKKDLTTKNAHVKYHSVIVFRTYGQCKGFPQTSKWGKNFMPCSIDAGT